MAVATSFIEMTEIEGKVSFENEENDDRGGDAKWVRAEMTLDRVQ
jgi:hypothetical protein